MEKEQSDQRCLEMELTQGRKLARKFQTHLKNPCSSSESSQVILQKILNSYENALSILNQSYPIGTSNLSVGESLPQMNESPRSEDSDREFKDTTTTVKFNRSKTVLPKWTKQVRVPPESGLEGVFEDGFSWRKYGQKDILGCKYQRGYYRCSYRNVHNCIATKQVQKSDEDSTIYNITYRGQHTCTQATVSAVGHHLQEGLSENQEFFNEENQLSREILLDFQSGLRFNNHSSCRPFVTFPFPAGNEYYVGDSDFMLGDFLSEPSSSQSGHLVTEEIGFVPCVCEMSASMSIKRPYLFSEAELDSEISFNDLGFW